MIAAAPAAAARVEDPAALSAYARAAAADSLGLPDEAARRYAAALALSPDNEVLQAAAFRHGIEAGDKALALRAAQGLARSGKLGPDARLVLFADHAARKDWKGASAQLDILEKVELFSFLAPLLRAWVAQGSGKGDPLALLAGIKDNPFATSYAAEHRPLLLLADGKKAQALAALAALGEPEKLSQRLRIAFAARLAAKGDRTAALALLEGQAPAIAAARAAIVARKPLPGAIATAAQGLSELLLRFAADAGAAEAPDLALTFARIATFLAPEDAAPWLLTAELLAARERSEPALKALRNISAADPLAASAADLRLAILSGSGRSEDALAEAKAALAAEPASVQNHARLGDLLSVMKRPAEAAAAYGEALSLMRKGAASPQPEWSLLLMRGDALTQAGAWAEGKKALEEAYKLAPDQAVVLNYLGYSQLERRENTEEAERLIRQASKLQPQDHAITDSLGWALYIRGDLPQAIALLERAAAGEPADTAINEHLGDAYYSAGRRFEARYAWQAALVHAEGQAAERLRAKLDRGLSRELAAP